MSSDTLRLLLKLGENNSITESLELSEYEFPELSKLLKGPDPEPIIVELQRLISRYWQPRAERWNTKHLARVVYIRSDGVLQAEPAIVQDISLSGVRLSIKRTAQLELLSLAASRIQLIDENGGGNEILLDIPSWFVRVAAVNDRSVSLAFTFDSLEKDQREALNHLRNTFGESSS